MHLQFGFVSFTSWQTCGQLRASENTGFSVFLSKKESHQIYNVDLQRNETRKYDDDADWAKKKTIQARKISLTLARFCMAHLNTWLHEQCFFLSVTSGYLKHLFQFNS